MDDLVERLRAEIADQRNRRGTILDYGDPDPLLVEALARITALEAALAEAEGRVIAEVVAWLEARSLRQDTVSSVLVLAEAATALETGAWKKDSPPPSTV